MPMVETSVAVATPPTTAQRINTGKARTGSATSSNRKIARAGGRTRPDGGSARARNHTTTAIAIAKTRPGISPPVNRSAIETDVTVPIVISTRDGGMVSLMAPDAARIATNSPGRAPRSRISGNSTGATAAMSAAYDPAMPETR